MVRGHAKLVAQQRNAAKQVKEKGSQMEARKAGLTASCPICKALALLARPPLRPRGRLQAAVQLRRPVPHGCAPAAAAPTACAACPGVRLRLLTPPARPGLAAV